MPPELYEEVSVPAGDPAALAGDPAALAGDMAMAGEEMQAEVDDMLPTIQGMFSQTAMNALVDAVNAALIAGGFEGSYPSFDSDVTEFPPEFVRLIAMLADAALELGAGELTLEGLQDDRDVAMLASQIQALAEDPNFASGMTESTPGTEEPLPPAAPAQALDDEALMMERM